MAGTERYVRNSTADFLVFTKDSETDGIEVRVQDHEVWLTQKGIGQLFDVDRSVVAKHLRNIFAENELSESTTCAKFAQVADNGKTYHYKFYSLPAIIAVGYRTNSTRATQFRQWATKVLDTFTRQGYVLDKDRLINGQIFDEDYFDHLVSEIQGNPRQRAPLLPENYGYLCYCRRLLGRQQNDQRLFCNRSE